MDKIEFQIAQTLKDGVGVDVEVTIRGTANEKLDMTISGSQYDAIVAAVFMARKGLAVLDGAISYIEDPETAYFYMTS
jgi:hypothetical protein